MSIQDHMTDADRAQRRRNSAGSTSFYVKSDYIPKHERDLIYEQTGVHVERRSDMDPRLKAAGKRILEKGEPGDRMRRDVKEWMDSGGERSGVPAPRMEDYAPPPPPKRHLDMRQLFRENLERARSKFGR